MKKGSLRASFAIIMALLVIVGLVIYVLRFVKDGEKWALYFDESTSNCTYTLMDRDGTVLAKMGGGSRTYADDANIRAACYQLVGDFGGNIGTGALQSFSRQLSGYNIFTGVEEQDDIDLKLTVDADLNVKAYEALNGRSGAVLVANYKTGEILCMVSSPSIDPSKPPSKLPDGAYINRCISSSFTPGSIFKLITLTAAIENIDNLYQRTFTCNGKIDVKGVTVTCTGHHGNQTIEQALANSCNCVFGTLALEMGADTLGDYADMLGLTSPHKLDNITTAAGKFDRDNSGSASLAWSGIGQYNDLVCPYSMLRVVSAIANNGTLAEPSLLGVSETKSTLLKSSTASKISSMMNYNVTYKYGKSTFPGLNISGKTGTAEVGNGQASHGWFVGFLNDEEHPYAFVVLVEHGGSGLGSAGAVANTVLHAAVK